MLFSLDEWLRPRPLAGHLPVLLKESLDLLSLRAGQRVLDATFGGGGHSRAFLLMAEGVEVVAMDRDPDAEVRARGLEHEFGDRFRFLRMNFGDLADLEMGPFDAAFFDFGLSSFQVDDGRRGFSFRTDAPVDMRMNPEAGISAAEFLETAPDEALIRAIRDYGEERNWRRVVRAIKAARGTGRLQRTLPLAGLIAEAAGAPPPGRRGIHPATRSFQGIRVEVNDELSAIERGLPAAFDRLLSGGVLAAISFHSLEDRIVKRYCRRMAGRPEHADDSRLQEERVRLAEMVHTRPIGPSEEEISRNPRSRSARLRALRKLNIHQEAK